MIDVVYVYDSGHEVACQIPVDATQFSRELYEWGCRAAPMEPPPRRCVVRLDLPEVRLAAQLAEIVRGQALPVPKRRRRLWVCGHCEEVFITAACLDAHIQEQHLCGEPAFVLCTLPLMFWSAEGVSCNPHFFQQLRPQGIQVGVSRGYRKDPGWSWSWAGRTLLEGADNQCPARALVQYLARPGLPWMTTERVADHLRLLEQTYPELLKENLHILNWTIRDLRHLVQAAHRRGVPWTGWIPLLESLPDLWLKTGERRGPLPAEVIQQASLLLS